MAMYYYASKISAVACGTRCKQQQQQQQQQQHQQHQNKQCSRNKDILDNSITATTILDDCDNPNNGDFDKMTKYSDKASLMNSGPQTISGSSKELPEVTCKDAPSNFDISDAALGPNGVMYKNGSVVSGPLDSLVDLIMPMNIDEFDHEYIFSFLLSSRLFIRPHDLLGKFMNAVPDKKSLRRIVELLKVWTKIFPYDFRDERIMNHVKHIASKCADTELGEEISELLRALLIRLTDLECHEEELRACQSNTFSNDKKETIETIRWPSASQLAQLLCRIERKLAKHVGPEEFVQCNENVLNHDRIKSSSRTDSHHSASTTTNVLLPKKTCNLESYLEWSARLRLLVANEILQCTGIRDRSKTVELWSGAAQYCLLVGNYNSATAILESLDTPSITRLQVTWSKLSTTCQQLDCMQRHAEGCGDLWNKQTITTCNNSSNSNGLLEKTKTKQIVIATPSSITTSTTTIPSSSSQSSTTSSSTTTASTVKRSKHSSMLKSSSSSSTTGKSPNEWVVIPIFSDIVRLALNVREDCSTILPNGHINMAAFDRLAAIVGAFTRHMSEVNQTLPDIGEYESLCQYIQSCSLISESDLMLASFDCEEPTLAEKKEYGVA